MKPLFAASLAIFMTTWAGAALAELACGKVSEVDAENHEIVLENGHQIFFPDTVDLSEIIPGNTVRITYSVTDGRSEATRIDAHYDECGAN